MRLFVLAGSLAATLVAGCQPASTPARESPRRAAAEAREEDDDRRGDTGRLGRERPEDDDADERRSRDDADDRTDVGGRPPRGDDDAAKARPVDLGPAPRRYLSLSEITSLVRDWAATAPELVEVGTYATIAGHEAPLVKLRPRDGGAILPKVLINAATHGDEPISTATVLGVAHELLSRYGKDDEVTRLLRTREVHVVPVVCPDGYAAASREVEGQDPNRSFPSPIVPGRSPASCAGALMQLFQAERYDATIDYHASGRMMMYPWSHTTARLPDAQDRAYRAITSRMARVSGYAWGQIPSLVRYTAEGSSTDYFHFTAEQAGRKTAALAVEVGRAKRPPPGEIAEEVRRNTEALTIFIREAPKLFAAGEGAFGLLAEAPEPPAEQELPYFAPGLE